MDDCSFYGGSLREIAFAGELCSCNFFDCTFVDCDFASLILQSVVFEKCRFSASTLGSRGISEAALVDCRILD